MKKQKLQQQLKKIRPTHSLLSKPLKIEDLQIAINTAQKEEQEMLSRALNNAVAILRKQQQAAATGAVTGSEDADPDEGLA